MDRILPPTPTLPGPTEQRKNTEATHAAARGVEPPRRLMRAYAALRAHTPRLRTTTRHTAHPTSLLPDYRSPPSIALGPSPPPSPSRRGTVGCDATAVDARRRQCGGSGRSTPRHTLRARLPRGWRLPPRGAAAAHGADTRSNGGPEREGRDMRSAAARPGRLGEPLLRGAGGFQINAAGCVFVISADAWGGRASCPSNRLARSVGCAPRVSEWPTAIARARC